MPKGETSRPYDATLKNLAKGGGTFKRAAKSISAGDEANRKSGKLLGSLDRTLNVRVNDAKGLQKTGRYSGKARNPGKPGDPYGLK